MAEKKELQEAASGAGELTRKTACDWVANKVKDFIDRGELFLPQGYSPENAMKQAYLILQNTKDRNKKPVLEVCSQTSIANALLEMIVLGLNPGKKQCYFIAYGTELGCQRSYFGSMALAKTVNPNIGEFTSAVVYDGDIFKYGILNGKKSVISHEQELDNIDKKKIKAAYCIITDNAGNPIKTEIMTFDEILQAWKQSPINPISDNGTVKPGSTHGKFTADMAMKTVTNKACKIIINSSNDSTLLIQTLKRNEDMADRVAAETVISEKANSGPILSMGTAEPEKKIISDPEKKETLADEGPAIHPAWGLCIEQRDCKKYEILSECSNAAVETQRNKCVHGMELEKKENAADPGPAHCPNNDDKITDWSVCVGCDDLEGCPVR